jgi:CRP/FNR family transcriptional regulator, anaerobic regulatory protein
LIFELTYPKKMENLFNFLSAHIEITSAFKSHLIKITKIENYHKNALIIEQGQKLDRLYFSEKGIIRKFTVRNGKEITTYFLDAYHFFTCIHALNRKTPSQYSFELISPGLLISIAYNDFFDLFSKFPEIAKVYHNILENYYLREENRAVQLQSLSAQERYEDFVANFSKVMEYANLGDIASYLGITQETLSRIRGKLKEVKSI